MNEDAKKLVRGLKDLSPLFGVVPEEVVARRSPEVQILGVSSPDCEGDSLFLNTFFASQLLLSEKACSLVSVLSRCSKNLPREGEVSPELFGEHLQRYSLYWDELRDLVGGASSGKSGGVLQSRDIFLDFEYRHLLHFEGAICLLDKWVLLLKPNAESLTEGYKMMKVGHSLNPQLEFCIVLEGRAEEAKGEMLFKRFSDFTMRYLDIQLGWLGWMDLADPARHFSSALHVEPLRFRSWDPKPSLQKFVLAHWVESLEKKMAVGISEGGSR